MGVSNAATGLAKYWQDGSYNRRGGAPHFVLSLVEPIRNSIDSGARHGPMP